MNNRSPLLLNYLEAEKHFTEERSKAKDNYWTSQDMSFSDYKGIVHNIPLSFDVFQAGTQWSYLRNPVNVPLDMYLSIGLAEEIGETVSHIKKKYRDDEGILTEKRRAKLVEEAGDALYYFAALLHSLGISLEDVAKQSQEKSVRRYKERFMDK